MKRVARVLVTCRATTRTQSSLTPKSKTFLNSTRLPRCVSSFCVKPSGKAGSRIHPDTRGIQFSEAPIWEGCNLKAPEKGLRRAGSCLLAARGFLVCLCVCVCVYDYFCACVNCVCLHEETGRYVYVCLCVYICLPLSLHDCIHLRVSVFICVSPCVFVCV